jgi:hypothetical protein
MKKGLSVLRICLMLMALTAISLSAAKYLYYHDYTIEVNVPCNSASENCFVGDGQDTPLTYKKIEKKAFEIAPCNGWLNECPVLTCQGNDLNCDTTYCNPSVEECVPKSL